MGQLSEKLASILSFLKIDQPCLGNGCHHWVEVDAVRSDPELSCHSGGGAATIPRIEHHLVWSEVHRSEHIAYELF